MALDDRATYSFDDPGLLVVKKISYVSVLARGCGRSVKMDMRKTNISHNRLHGFTHNGLLPLSMMH